MKRDLGINAEMGGDLIIAVDASGIKVTNRAFISILNKIWTDNKVFIVKRETDNRAKDGYRNLYIAQLWAIALGEFYRLRG